MKIFIVEFSDNQYCVMTEQEYLASFKSAEEFDGFVGFTDIAEIDLNQDLERRMFKLPKEIR